MDGNEAEQDYDDSEETRVHFQKQLLKILGDFRDKEAENDYSLYNITNVSEAFRNGYKLCQEFVESFGETNEEISFEFLCKMQNFHAFQYL